MVSRHNDADQMTCTLSKGSSECNFWFSPSVRERKSSSDVARLVGNSEHSWLADDVIRRSSANLNARIVGEH